MCCGNIAKPVEADVGWRIANAVDWQPQRLVVNSSTDRPTAAPCAEGVGGQSERAYTKPAQRRPTNASQHAVTLHLMGMGAGIY